MTAAPGADRGELATKAPSSIPPSLEGKGAVEVVSTRDRHGNPLRTVLCTETGLVRNDPVPGDEELAKFYSEEYRIAYKGGLTARAAAGSCASSAGWSIIFAASMSPLRSTIRTGLKRTHTGWVAAPRGRAARGRAGIEGQGARAAQGTPPACERSGSA